MADLTRLDAELRRLEQQDPHFKYVLFGKDSASWYRRMHVADSFEELGLYEGGRQQAKVRFAMSQMEHIRKEQEERKPQPKKRKRSP